MRGTSLAEIQVREHSELQPVLAVFLVLGLINLTNKSYDPFFLVLDDVPHLMSLNQVTTFTPDTGR